MTQSERSYSAAEVRTIAYMAAGVGSGAVMRRAPKVVMPTEEIEQGVESLLADAENDALDFREDE